jgi:hypothetical protein
LFVFVWKMWLTPSYVPLLTTPIGWEIQQNVATAARNVGHVLVVHQRLHNRLAGLNLPERDKSLSRTIECF